MTRTCLVLGSSLCPGPPSGDCVPLPGPVHAGLGHEVPESSWSSLGEGRPGHFLAAGPWAGLSNRLWLC